MMDPGARCAVRGMLSNCGAEATAMCVYCGRPFCDKHGAVYEDGAEVCTRKNCLAKREDLDLHLLYKAEVYERNVTRLCGLAVCETEIQVRCYRCRGYFCVAHTAPWLETITDNPERVCTHCVERRPVWERE